MASYRGFCILHGMQAARAATRGNIFQISAMWCRGAMNCAPTPQCVASCGCPHSMYPFEGCKKPYNSPYTIAI